METTVRPFGWRDKIGSTDGDKVFLFENVPLKDGENTLTATSGLESDTITLLRVKEPNPEYELKNSNVGTGAANWFTPAENSSRARLTISAEK